MIFHCGACDNPLTPGIDQCARCGSTEIMMATFTPGGARVSASVGSNELRLTGKNHETVKKNPFLRTTIKREWSNTRQEWEYVERVINKIDRTYHETYRSLATGEVTFEKSGPLDDQSLHGPRGKRK